VFNYSIKTMHLGGLFNCFCIEIYLDLELVCKEDSCNSLWRNGCGVACNFLNIWYAYQNFKKFFTLDQFVKNLEIANFEWMDGLLVVE
jgi:hypothetical protein